MEGGSERLRWGVRRRLEFIDFRLFWDGRFNRSDMAETFGISAQQASADIARYEREAPNNLTYDRAEKAYRRTENFAPAFIGETVERYLLQLVAIENRWMRHRTRGSTPSRQSKSSPLGAGPSIRLCFCASSTRFEIG